MAGPQHPLTVARMDSLIQLEYILERERSRGPLRQHLSADEARVRTATTLIDHLRRIVDLRSTARGAGRYA